MIGAWDLLMGIALGRTISASRSCWRNHKAPWRSVAQKKRRASPPSSHQTLPSRSGRDGLVVAGIAQHVAAPPDGLDVVPTAGRRLQLLAQLADEHVDDLELGLVHAAVQMIEEHLLGQRRALAQREQLEHLVLLARQMHALALHLDRLGVEV